MFDRFVRLAQAKRALKDGHFEAALGLVEDPLIRDQKRAQTIRSSALQGLMARAGRRAEAGSVSAAIKDVDVVLGRAPEFDGAQSLRRVLDEQRVKGEAQRKDLEDRCRKAREYVECGRLGDAEALLRSGDSPPDASVDSVRALISTRRESAQRSSRETAEAIRAGSLERAREALDAARAFDAGLKGVDELQAQLVAAAGSRLMDRLNSLRDSCTPSDVLHEVVAQRVLFPAISGLPEVRAAVRAATQQLKQGIVEALEAGEIERALDGLSEMPADEREVVLSALGISIAQLAELTGQRQRGDLPSAAVSMRTLADALGASGLRAAADKLECEGESADGALEQARDLAAQGDLVQARSVLVGVLESSPMHEAARREMDLIDEGARDKQQRLATARGHAKDGRLRDATAIALALAVPGPNGEEARLLLRDVQARIDVVQRGLQQVQRDAHGRSSGSREGIQHCVSRLEELGRLQTDEPELERLASSLRAELDGMAALDRVGQALERVDLEAIVAAFAEFESARSAFLGPERLEARTLELADRAIEEIERGMAAGRLTAAGELASAFVGRVGDRSVEGRITELSRKIEQRSRETEHQVEAGFAALQSRNLDAAEECLANARVAWLDGAAVRRLETAIASVRDCDSKIASVESLAENADVGAAKARLEQLGPTQALFRTRIFDLKKNLARAQGLDHAFLLRVDEGGEFLVVRGETVSIGNLRDGGADLPVLANLAGRHARIRRSMSFHGGMEDRIEADQGELFVGDKKVDRAPLRDGKSVRLGRSFDLHYRVPSKRSLSAMLTMRGFTVAGTDKVLLMKDRGRDGRIVIGRGQDVHVRVASAACEVEIFASKDGQIRVRYEGGGTMDGRPFSGEEPVAAGAVVVCGEVSFVLQPWSKA